MAEKVQYLDPTKIYFLGFKEKEDDYEITDEKTGKTNKGHYHNFIISLSEPYNQQEKSLRGSIGQESNLYKVKAEYMPYIFGETPETFNPLDYSTWFGQAVEVLYDKKGNLKSIRLDKAAFRTAAILES